VKAGDRVVEVGEAGDLGEDPVEACPQGRPAVGSSL
jgi:hypothetical protein